MQSVVEVRHVGKRFRRHHADRPMTLKEAVIRGFRRLGPADVFWAVDDVSFDILPGQTVGLVGANGAGKSTLLRLIGGVGRPDTGSIAVRGRIGALLDLGTGFHPDLTGRENVYVSGVIAGLTRHEVAERFDSIVAFSELEDFIDSPLRTYSTGMNLRLAFAVAVHIEPDLLLIDEVLAVGDIAFQRKCLDRIGEFKAKGCAIVLVTHDASAIRDLCDEAIWLRKGRMVAHGPAGAVVDQYVDEMSQETRRRTPDARTVESASTDDRLELNRNRWGSLEAEITAVRLLDERGQPVTELAGGSGLRVELDYVAHQQVPPPIFGVAIAREDGIDCFDGHLPAAEHIVEPFPAQGTASLVFDRLDLASGTYHVNVGIYQHDWGHAYDYHWQVYQLAVTTETQNVKGVLSPPHRWVIGDNSTKVYGHIDPEREYGTM